MSQRNDSGSVQPWKNEVGYQSDLYDHSILETSEMINNGNISMNSVRFLDPFKYFTNFDSNTDISSKKYQM